MGKIAYNLFWGLIFLSIITAPISIGFWIWDSHQNVPPHQTMPFSNPDPQNVGYGDNYCWQEGCP